MKTILLKIIFDRSGFFNWQRLLILVADIILKNYLHNFLSFYYDVCKKKLFLYIRNESGIFNEVLYSCVKDSLVLGLERLIKNIYLFVNPNTYNFIGIILLSYYFHVNNGESFILFVACAGNNLLFKSLVVDLNTYFSYILDLYIGFILILNFTYNLINSHEFKVNNPLIYNIFIWVCIILLFSLAFLFFFYLNKLILTIIEIIVEKLVEFILKMMATGPGPSGNLPGGFGQPVGGGGKPPKKPGDPIHPKGHYNEDDSDTGYRSYSSSEDNANEPPQKEEKPVLAPEKKYTTSWSPNMTEEERLSYNEYSRLKKKLRKERETPEQKRQRMDKDNERRRLKWKNQTPELRRLKLDIRNADLAWGEMFHEIADAPESNQARLAEKRAKARINKLNWKKRIQENETAEEKRQRLDRDNQWVKIKKFLETPEQRRQRLDRKNERARLARLKKKEDKNKKNKED